ncbi:Transformation system protein [hydrothermal vent metagenome]|uniref:Transformation system protein n=1 Tax=hydrothermal vent metagenome TaxID=652676 RepID=A0A1W1BEN4_9ZZZZ
MIMNDALMELSTEKEATLQAESSLEKEDTLVDIPLLEVSEKQDVVSPVEKKRKKVHLDIIKTNKIDAYRDVEKRFSLSHDIDDALFLAKSFYKKARYKKSEYWAYEVNKIDNNNVESILIFVKSKVKLGKRNEAISILNDYVKRTNLNEAKILLRKIEKHQL